ncbi:hypothetical protein ACPUER_03905 [Burkholderia sp. DN3021]|nr:MULTISPECIES: hypothetical protein [Burkholderia]
MQFGHCLGRQARELIGRLCASLPAREQLFDASADLRALEFEPVHA